MLSHPKVEKLVTFSLVDANNISSEISAQGAEGTDDVGPIFPGERKHSHRLRKAGVEAHDGTASQAAAALFTRIVHVQNFHEFNTSGGLT